MKFDIEKTIEILERTPGVLTSLLHGISDDWVMHNEGPETWSPYDVLGHLIHGEKTDWIPRLQIILEHGIEKPFEPFDRFAQFELGKERSLHDLLSEFTRLRLENLRILRHTPLDEEALDKKGFHPEFGEVSLRAMLAAWTAHDLGHIIQISRVMAWQYRTEVGPWGAYLKVVSDQ